MFIVKNKNTRMTSPFSSVFIVDFEQVIVSRLIQGCIICVELPAGSLSKSKYEKHFE